MVGLTFPKNLRTGLSEVQLVRVSEVRSSSHVTLSGSYSYEMASNWLSLWSDDVHNASYPGILRTDILGT